MWYWAELVRLTRAMRHLHSIRANIIPRLEQIRRELDMSGRFAESYELQNVRLYLEKLSKDTHYEIANQYNMIAQSYGVRAPRTTPLIVATNEDIYTS